MSLSRFSTKQDQNPFNYNLVSTATEKTKKHSWKPFLEIVHQLNVSSTQIVNW